MPASFKIISQNSTYTVEVRVGAAKQMLEEYIGAHIIVDAVLVKQLSPTEPCLPIEATEDNKEYEAIAPYIKRLREMRLTRKNLIIAIGGGVIQDISGFVASIYMRGIKWHYLPTTLLGMVDSCIGGKSSINVAGTKNLVGTYYPPESVIIDPLFIATLRHEQIIDGICEAAKICFADPDPRTFDEYMKLECLEPLSPEAYENLIVLTLKTKKWFIEKDEFDQNERLLLNFGHTFGHAIEIAGEYAISHGIGVGLGMLCAIEFMREGKDHPRVRQLKDHTEALLRSVVGLAERVRELDVDRIMTAFQTDKKHSPNEYVIIIPDKNGQLIREKVVRGSDCDKALAQAIQRVTEVYGKI